MAPIVTPNQITLTVVETITSISSSIYEASSVTFNDDILTSTTVDINLSKITNIDSWCPQNPFKVNPVI
jgi:hypothetical protein